MCWQFQRARAAAGPEPAVHRIVSTPGPQGLYNNDVGGGGWGGELREPGGAIQVGTKAHTFKERLDSAADAADASAGSRDTQGGGGDAAGLQAAGDGVGAGGSWAKDVPPPPLSAAPAAARPARPTPLGRDRPLQIMAAAPGASSINTRWPAASGGGGGDGDGDAAAAAEAGTVGNFACSLTEVDYAPGQEARSSKQQKQSWSTSGPCVISCSPPPSSPGSPSPEGESSLDPFRYCARAVRACELYQECTHVLMPPPPPANGEMTAETSSGDNGSGGLGFATLMHLPAEDGSMAGVEAAAKAGAARAVAGTGWGGGGGGGFTLEQKPRTYYVVSFGGSGSKMLGGWLSERGSSMVKKVGGWVGGRQV